MNPGPGPGPAPEPDPAPGSSSGPGPEPLPDSTPGQPPAIRCAMCGQPLRDRASRLWGLGPDCRAKLQLRTAPAPPTGEVDQETLPGT